VICEIETGKQKPWRFTLINICDALEIPANDRRRIFKHFNHEDADFNDPAIILRTIRVKEGITQDQLAKLAGTNRGTISNFEKGEVKNVELAARICDALEIGAEDKASILNYFHEDNEHQEPSDGVHAGMQGEPAHCTD